MMRTTINRYRSTFANITSNNNSTNTSSLDTILNRGDRGVAVKSLQEKLILLGYSCGSHGADGDFGIGTESAVRKFQSDHGLSVDGIAGCQTLNAIDAAISKISNGSTKVKVTANVLNVRSGAGISNPVVSNVRKGAICELLEEKNGWGKINSPSGWVCMEYVEKVN
ncbi:MAG: peptidoglycan-binding protein [Faecousia sp.]